MIKRSISNTISRGFTICRGFTVCRGLPRILVLARTGFLIAAMLIVWTFYENAGSVEAAESKGQMEMDRLDVIVTSDLHFTLSEKVSNLIVPAIKYSDAFTDAFFDEVIDRRPDVFIMTGDNTNGGTRRDSLELARRLEKIRDAGIRIILTTGNHDLNHSKPVDFEEYYCSLAQMDERDQASLSYITVVGNTAFFAMDDSTAQIGGPGSFTEATLAWLEEMLEKYASYHIILLSHHNVLAGKGAFDSSSYRIQCEPLAPMLVEHGVPLILTGHLHAQMMVEENGTYEIISGMPCAPGHKYGFIRISQDGLTYELQEVDLAKYGGEELSEAVRLVEEESYNRQTNAYKAYLQKKGYSPEMQEGITRLLMQFLGWYSLGSLADHEQEVLEDPFYDPMIEALWSGNYGPWIVSVMKNVPMNATRLDLEW